mgnify:CR=1 FL=1
MINWIKSFFVTEEKETKPKCASCGLGATKYVLMEFKTLALEDLEEKIMKELIKITDAEFALLCYIKEVARELVNGMDYEKNDMIVDVINMLLDAHCAVEEEE